jgi:hypothetical protein
VFDGETNLEEGWDDYDDDYICNEEDWDDDNDGVEDWNDVDPFDNFVCGDMDEDTCEDCIMGFSDPIEDGEDNDLDGWCNEGDQWPECPNYPINVDPYDECGECNGDGVEQTCGCGSPGELGIPEGECDCYGNINDCSGECGGTAELDSCGTCDSDWLNDCYELYIELHNNNNLISFPALPLNGDYSVQNMFSQLCDNIIGVFGEGKAFVNMGNCNFIGSLTEVQQDEGYWVVINEPSEMLLVFDAVPVSNDSNGEVVYNMHYGPNLISYPFQESQLVYDALGYAEENVYALLGQGISAMNMGGEWVGSLIAFEGGSGYWLMALNDFKGYKRAYPFTAHIHCRNTLAKQGIDILFGITQGIINKL